VLVCAGGSSFSGAYRGGLEISKSGVGTDFGLLVRVIPGPNKQREAKSSILLS
jgi:hypothetical protein